MAYLQLTVENKFYRLLKDDVDKEAWSVVYLEGLHVYIEEDKFHKIQMGRLNVPDCTDINNIIWEPEVTNELQVIGEDGNYCSCIRDKTKDNLNIWVKHFKERWEQQVNIKWIKRTEVENFITWLNAQVANNWVGTNFPVVGKTAEEIISEKYTGTFFSQFQI